MAPNKFATMLHRNTHKMTAILVYAVLEWTLIVLLLLNSLFSYLISKFASYFGLKQPCLWCSRIDHIFEPTTKEKQSYTHLVCETHATEISRLSYCTNHQRLADPNNMCHDCFTSLPDHTKTATGFVSKIAFLSWVSHDNLGDADKVATLSCSCCNQSLNITTTTTTGSPPPPCFLLKPFSWDGLRYPKKGIMCNEEECKEQSRELDKITDHEHQVLSDVESFSFREGGEDCSRSSQSDDKEGNDQDDKVIGLNNIEEKHDHHNVVTNLSLLPCCFGEDSSFQIMDVDSQNCIDYDDSNRLFPVELIDSSTTASQILPCDSGKDLREHEYQNENFHAEPEIETEGLAQILSFGDNEQNLVSTKEPSDPPAATEAEDQLDGFNLGGEQAKSDKSEENDEVNDHAEPQEKPNSMNDNENETQFDQEHTVETSSLQEGIDHNQTLVSDSNEMEEEKFPETPTSIEGLKKLLMFDKREMGTEESLDGSVISEMECGDSSLSIEHMKTALKAERKALSAIYVELEEERSASAIAANQTMAMITRLQEEKAAMQMEALQYQRMMEEQSEYDQEALQLLNELMIKREKEKQELEIELEMYRKKVLEYEAREKVMMARARASSSCSQMEESDEVELSIDLNREAREEEEDISFYEQGEGDDHSNSNIQMVLDCVKHIGTFDESLTEFEEEKQAILDQLKTLEEKLLTVGDEQFFEDLKSIENLANIKGFDGIYEDSEGNERRSLGSMVKSLLPLLDAAENEVLEGSKPEEQVKCEALEMLNSLDSMFEMDHGKKVVAIDEEVDRVYERLQDIEVDREFLQRCMSSVQKGDNGVDILQEILQHLRDLRTVDLHLRNMNADQLQNIDVAIECDDQE